MPVPSPAAVAAALLLAVQPVLRAQAPATPTAPPQQQPAARDAYRVTAVRVDGGDLRLDGRVDEQAWAGAAPATGFVQRRPREGAPATGATEVRILYDDHALWIGARMRSATPGDVQAPVGRRDNVREMEHLVVSLDTYHDERTAYTFVVTASGVRGDWYHPRDDERARETSFDPVWQAAARVDAEGWTAEMRIPFSQLRFSASGAQRWGINLERWVASRNEDDLWAPIPQNVRAWSSRFGTLDGIDGIRPTRRVELLPYVAQSSRVNAARHAANPFDDGRNLSTSVGGDLKVGLGPNLTLEATANPDFGQVEADPAVVNLSAFEINFPERRPFFVENAPLLQGGGNNYFYSRRIGAAPQRRAAGDFVDAPTTSTILGAAKLTGRLPSGLSVGVLAALTGRMTATTFDTARAGLAADAAREERARVDVAPRSAFAVGRLQQEFGRHRSTAGVLVTAVRRDLAPGSPLAALYARDALVGAVDWNLRLARATYELSGSVSASHVGGDSAAVLRVQRASARFFQRPDAGDYVRYDPGRTALGGYSATLALERISGRHWLWRGTFGLRSPGFEINDLGFLQLVDRKFFVGRLAYRETRPTRWLQSYEIAALNQNVWNYGNELLSQWVRPEVSLVWRNFFETTLVGEVEAPTLNAHLTRGGPYMRTQARQGLGVELASPQGASTRVTAGGSWARDAAGGRILGVSLGGSVRPGPQWQLSLTPGVTRQRDPRQYVARLAAGDAATTLDDRYVFATLDYAEVNATVRLNYTLRPDLTLETFLQPFAASGRYSRFGQLRAPRSGALDLYPAAGAARAGVREIALGDGQTLRVPTAVAGEDFTTRAMRSNAVLRWEWRPGSTLFAVWQQTRDGYLPAADGAAPRAARLGDLADALRGRRNHVFAVKASYWLPASGRT
jgi:hypothetical protein